jgi:tRNA(fMet)-specific endonuclease VapC
MLDTNVVSLLIRKHPQVLKKAMALPIASLCISAVTEGELHYGLARRPKATQLRLVVIELLKRLDVLPWNSATALRYGAVRADLERQGKPLAPLDLLIAAHALEVGAVLATNGRAFKQLAGLEIQDWTTE